jgi:hypothetical protein
MTFFEGNKIAVVQLGINEAFGILYKEDRYKKEEPVFREANIVKYSLKEPLINVNTGEFTDFKRLYDTLEYFEREFRPEKNVKRAVASLPSLADKANKAKLEGALIKSFGKNAIILDCEAVAYLCSAPNALIIDTDYSILCPVIGKRIKQGKIREFTSYEKLLEIQNERLIRFKQVMEDELFDDKEGIPKKVSDVLEELIDINQEGKVAKNIYVIGRLTESKEFQDLFDKYMLPKLEKYGDATIPRIISDKFTILRGLFEYSKKF